MTEAAAHDKQMENFYCFRCGIDHGLRVLLYGMRILSTAAFLCYIKENLLPANRMPRGNTAHIVGLEHEPTVPVRQINTIEFAV